MKFLGVAIWLVLVLCVMLGGSALGMAIIRQSLR